MDPSRPSGFCAQFTSSEQLIPLCCLFLHRSVIAWHNLQLKICLFLPPQNVDSMKFICLSPYWIPSSVVQVALLEQRSIVLEENHRHKAGNKLRPTPQMDILVYRELDFSSSEIVASGNQDLRDYRYSFLNHLRARCRQNASSYYIIQRTYSPHKDILLHSYNINIRIR